MIPVDAQTLHELVGETAVKSRNRDRIIATAGPILAATLLKYEINTRYRIADFLAQCCYESDYFKTMTEYATGEEYNGRADLGNTEPDDGPRYKGRGWLQCTGRYNYGRYSRILGLQLITHPELLEDPVNGLEVSCAYWKDKNLNRQADMDDIVRITEVINGGRRGLADRVALTTKAKNILARLEAVPVHATVETTAPPLGVEHPVLHRGMTGDGVITLQRTLNLIGAHLQVDGIFGPTTEYAVIHLQGEFALDADGIVGPVTWEVIDGEAYPYARMRPDGTTFKPGS